MDIDVSVGKESLTINVENPHGSDLSSAVAGIVDFSMKQGIDVTALELEKLIPRMVKGVSGCQDGCPSNAKSLVREGFGNFSLAYVEGGILSAVHNLENGNTFSVKVFPEFK